MIVPYFGVLPQNFARMKFKIPDAKLRIPQIIRIRTVNAASSAGPLVWPLPDIAGVVEGQAAA